MNDDGSPGPLADLPEELARLDAELRDIHLHERPSFGPELKAECERVWLEGPPAEAETGPILAARQLLAAASLALLFGSLSVPPARAALAELSRSALVSVGVLDEVEPPSAEATAPILATPPLRMPLETGTRMDPPPAVIRDLERTEPAPAVADEREDEPTSSAFTGISATFPELVDRRSEQLAIRRHYPEDLIERGIGGTVRLQVWVDPTGRVDDIDVRGSGYPELDRAARRAVAELRFVPATRGGSPVGTWVEFDMVFEPRMVEDDDLPTVPPGYVPVGPESAGELDLEVWSPETIVAPPVSVETRELLRNALADVADVADLGSVESLLRGIPPAGVAPLPWRMEAMDVLRAAISARPRNPAPYLALGRILKKQGLTSEAQDIFEQGIERADDEHSSSAPALAAELQYERGMLLKASWLASAALGRLVLRAEDTPRCARTEVPAEPTSPEALIALNFLCPGELERVMDLSFQPLESGIDLRREMTRAFEAAVEADPGHAGANREILLDLAGDERWYEVLTRSRRFARASYGHPHAFLFAGISLQRLGRSEEARDEFTTAFRGLSADQRAAMTSIRPLLTGDELTELDDLPEERRPAAVRSFWVGLDPILGTEVNEREVEHLARASWAMLRFGGIDTDAGDVWLRYGAPQRIRAVGADTELLAEFWDYGGAPYVTFRRPAMSTQLELSAEARAYLEDLRHVFPHRYGSRARRVSTLPAVVTRFRLPRGGWDVQIRSTVPEAFQDRDPEDLKLAVFTLGADGTILSSRSLDAARTDIVVQEPAGPEAAAVVLEVWDRQHGEAASVRIPVPRGAAEGEDSRISDLLFLDGRPAPGNDVSRDDRWLKPLPPGEVSADRVSALFELYGLGNTPYRTRVEAIPNAGGEPLAVPHRPAGETHFVSTWSRRAVTGPGPLTEYLTLDLTAIPTGDYTVRVTVEFTGDRPPVVAEGTLYRVRGGRRR